MQVNCIDIDPILIDIVVLPSHLANKYLRQYHSHSVEQEVEWLYAFDVHANAFFCSYLVTYVLQVSSIPYSTENTQRRFHFFLHSVFPFAALAEPVSDILHNFEFVARIGAGMVLLYYPLRLPRCDHIPSAPLLSFISSHGFPQMPFVTFVAVIVDAFVHTLSMFQLCLFWETLKCSCGTRCWRLALRGSYWWCWCWWASSSISLASSWPSTSLERVIVQVIKRGGGDGGCFPVPMQGVGGRREGGGQ